MSAPDQSLVPVEEPAPFRRSDGGVGAGHVVAVPFQFLKGQVHPAALGGPVGHGSPGLPLLPHTLEDSGVEGNLHLVDGDAVGLKLKGFLPRTGASSPPSRPPSRR